MYFIANKDKLSNFKLYQDHNHGGSGCACCKQTEFLITNVIFYSCININNNSCTSG